MKEEGEKLLKPDSVFGDSISVDLTSEDPDEDIFQRATAKNRFRPISPHLQNCSSDVTFSEVSGPWHPELKAKEELSTGDSGAGTGTGCFTGTDKKYSS